MATSTIGECDQVSHSAGPWWVEKNHGGPSTEISADDGYVGSTAGTQHPGQIREANARLIAAAPDLLELAKQYASECADCNGTGKTIVKVNPDMVAESLCPDCADIRSCIAKAEGRS